MAVGSPEPDFLGKDFKNSCGVLDEKAIPQLLSPLRLKSGLFLHNATGALPQKLKGNKKAPHFLARLCFIWWAPSGSNRGPRDYESPI